MAFGVELMGGRVGHSVWRLPSEYENWLGSYWPTGLFRRMTNNNREGPRAARPRCMHIIPGNGGIRLCFSEELNYCRCCSSSARVLPAFCAWGILKIPVDGVHDSQLKSLCPCRGMSVCLRARATRCAELCMFWPFSPVSVSVPAQQQK